VCMCECVCERKNIARESKESKQRVEQSRRKSVRVLLVVALTYQKHKYSVASILVCIQHAKLRLQ
jgi:hypothetical protein